MKLKPYSEAILATKEEKDKLLAPARANETKASIGMKVAQLSIDIQQQEISITQDAARYPLNADNLVEQLDQLAWVERRRAQLEAIEKQLFPA